MREIIGDSAGKVWRTLSQHKEVSLSQIPKLVGGKDTVVYQALGWLACEDKVTDYFDDGGIEDGSAVRTILTMAGSKTVPPYESNP